MAIFFLSPFIGLALASAYVVSREFEARTPAAFAGGLAAVLTLWIVMPLTVLFLVALQGRSEAWEWANMVGTIAVLSVPVFVLGTLVGWHANRSANFRRGDPRDP
jgi:uncharacterized membrane protein YqjE